MRDFYLLVDPERDDIYKEDAKINNRNLGCGINTGLYRAFVILFHSVNYMDKVLKRRCKKLLVKSVL